MSGFDLSNFLASFFDEARERLSSINQALVQFESGKLTEEGMIALRRDAHTIKGSALMLGVTDIGKTAHIFEDMMEQLMANPAWQNIPAMIQFLYDIHDALDNRLQNIDSNQLIEIEPLRTQQEQLLTHIDSLPSENSEKEELHTKNHLAVVKNDTKPIQRSNLHETPEAFNSKQVIPLDDSALSNSNDTSESQLKKVTPDPPLLIPDSQATAEILNQNQKNETLDSPLSSDLIGADEAKAWKQQQQEKQEKKKFNDDLTPVIALSEPATAHHPSDKLLLPTLQQQDDAPSFRPDIDQIEMKATAQRKSSGRFLRVDAERLEILSNQVIELSTQQARDKAFETQFNQLSKEFRTLQQNFQHFSESMGQLDTKSIKQHLNELDINFEQQARHQRHFIEDVRYSSIHNQHMMRDLRDQVLSLMLRPLDNIFSTFPRSVRDLAIRLNKRVRLVIGGKTLEMDQGVTESLVEPLVHLLNNAVAHGIETPEERIAAGKPEEGQVSIIAQQNGSEIRIEIIDDGRGLNTKIIKETAISKGVTTQVEADQMDSAEILEMIFRPGFTTKEVVDDTSGRGIGMNVVQDAVRRLTGSIRIQSDVGHGTRFTLSIPVSIAVQFALIFRMGNMRFGMLTHMVEQAIPYRSELIQRASDGKEFIFYENYHVPLVDMRHVLGNTNNGQDKKKGNIIIAEHIEGYVGIVVDELLDDIEIVVRDLDPYIKRYNPQGLMGNTIASDGSVVMLLEPYGIKEMGRTSPNQNIDIHVEENEKLHFNILLVDDSLIAREVEKSIFENIGFIVDTAIDGLDALEKLQIKDYDMVVTDLEMPRLDGFGLVRRIRNQSRYENLPLMIISTRESTEDRMRALESGADTYMVKQQLKGDEILQTVKALIGSIPE